MSGRPKGDFSDARDRRRRGAVVFGTFAAFFALFHMAAALGQPSSAPIRIGVITTAWGPPAGVDELVEALAGFGYKENYDFSVGVWFTQGDSSLLPSIMTSLLETGVDIVVPFGPLAASAAQAATSTLPIVFVAVGDPVERGLIGSYAQPGGNTTGITDLNIENSGKRLQLFRDLVPGLSRVLFAYSERNPYHVVQAETYRQIAQRLGLTLVERPVNTFDEARSLFAHVTELNVDGILSPNDVDLNIPGFILEVSAQQSIPSMFDGIVYVELGGLASYGTSAHAGFRQAARLIDQIMRGADPGDVPVEAPLEMEFTINLLTADALGIAVSPDILVQASRLISVRIK